MIGDTADQGEDSGQGKAATLKDRQKALRDKLTDLQRRLERMRRGQAAARTSSAKPTAR